MKVIAVNKSAILIFELILDLDGLVLDSLLHDHVLEDAGSHLLRRAGGLHLNLSFDFKI